MCVCSLVCTAVTAQLSRSVSATAELNDWLTSCVAWSCDWWSGLIHSAPPADSPQVQLYPRDCTIYAYHMRLVEHRGTTGEGADEKYPSRLYPTQQRTSKWVFNCDEMFENSDVLSILYCVWTFTLNISGMKCANRFAFNLCNKHLYFLFIYLYVYHDSIKWNAMMMMMFSFFIIWITFKWAYLSFCHSIS